MEFPRRPQRGTAPWVALALLLAGAGGCGDGAPAEGAASPGGAAARDLPAPGAVAPGLEVLLRDSLSLVRGRRVGLVTNHTALARDSTHAIDLLRRAPDVELVALYSPEHGIRGEAEAGVEVAGGRDPATGLPVHSLYGDTRKPTPAMLEGVEVLLFDIQDVGARYYTYVSTMALSMEAAGDAGILFVVLDRPDPIGGEAVQGNVLEPGHASFVGMFPVPMRHGMTPGELARLFVGEFGIEVELSVVPAAGWRREMRFPETGLPWVAPSPNIPTVESALHYPGTCLFEGTALSVGRGTERAFQQIGAPWIDGEALARALQARGLPGARIEAVRFTPRDPGDGKFHGREVGGVRFAAAGPGYDPTRTAVAALVEARRLSAGRWSWRPAHFDRLAGTAALRRGIEAGVGPDALTAGWDAELRAFRALRAPYLLYP